MRTNVARPCARWVVVVGASVFTACGVGGSDDGSDAPWRAEYFEDGTLSGQPHFRTHHRALDFNWGLAAPLDSWVEDDFSIRWETCLRVDKLARITFRLASDDGSRLYVDDDRIIDNWGEHGLDFVASRTVVLNPGTYRVRVDYFEGSGFAGIRLATRSHGPESMEWLPPPARTDGEGPGLARCEDGDP